MTPKERAAMQQALEALEQEAKNKNYDYPWDMDNVPESTVKAIAALRKALVEQAEQEPVAIGTEWKPCMKLPVVVHVREQREGESHVSTREGITPVKPDDLIMRGVAGEEYPIGRELFNKTYTFDTAAPVRTKDLTYAELGELFVKAKEETFGYARVKPEGGISLKPSIEYFARAVIAKDRELNKCQH